MTRFLQQVVDGAASGAIYAALALALVLVHRTTNVVNFAQGEMAVVSTYVAWQAHDAGAPVGAAVALALAVSFAGGIAVHEAVIRPVERSSELTVVIVTLGLLVGFNGAAAYVWGTQVKTFPDVFPVRVWGVGGVRVTSHAVGVVAVLLAVVGVLWLVFTRTRTGLAMRAAAGNPESSRLLGIDVTAMLALGWGLAAVLGALAGVLVAPRLFLEPSMMLSVQVYAFAAATLGGFDSPLGAVVGGVVVGVAENLSGTYVSWIGNDLRIGVALILIVAVLLVRPQGLLGRRPVEWV